jgi:hypothetical protein
MTVLESRYEQATFGDYQVYKHGSLIEYPYPAFHTCKGLTYMVATAPWFSTKYTEDDDLTMEDMLEYWNENRNHIPYKSVKEFVEATNGKIIYNSGVATNEQGYCDRNACGLISLLNMSKFPSNMKTTDYRQRLSGMGSKPGQTISEDQLGEIASMLGIKIYFVHASPQGIFSVIISGESTSHKKVVIHSTNGHFERIVW